MLKVGIVGLPNVGKSTLFNALLKKQLAYVANYPFCTIEPNVGVVEVPDKRLSVLAKIVKTEKIIPATVEFYDIAGLIKGASEGEGLGNQFLAHIREVSVILHIVRMFKDENVVHVDKVNPLSDMETIEAELILADLATLDKQKEPRVDTGQEEKLRFEVIGKLKEALGKGTLAKDVDLSLDEKALISSLGLLTLKPVLYVFNISEKQLSDLENIKKEIEEIVPSGNFLIFSAKFENELLSLSEKEQKDYLKEYHLEDIGLNRLIKKSYSLLGLISFLTAGEKEARAWTIKKGTLAPQAAGVIHTDFEKNFIKADIIPFDDFVEYGGWVKARELGKVRTMGKDYTVGDGDVIEFKIGNEYYCPLKIKRRRYSFFA